jgi:hypothetical protein
MNILRRTFQRITPDFLLVFLRFVLEPHSSKESRKAVLAHFKNIDKSTLPNEILEGLKYLRCHKYSSFPYGWAHKYDKSLPEVIIDKTNNCFYVWFEGKKMYFPNHLSHSEIIWAVRAAMREQDPESPHLYLPGDFQVEPGSIVIDAGVAEGNFALSVVETAKRLYLVECDQRWMEALKLTFAPWKEKVVFIEKFMSDEKGDTSISVDSLLVHEKGEKYFIKLDIEGYEQKALSGMKNLVASGNHIKVDVCTYHHPEDLKEIKTTLQSYGFIYHVSDGYVLYFQEGEEPSFRKALIRAEKL